MSQLHLITGAAGLLGSHIAGHLVRDGQTVRALVRPTSDTAFLKNLNVELVEGDLHDVDSLRRAAEGVDVVYHCAAFVGDWGPWEKFYQGTVETTRNLVTACQAGGEPRILHVSSISVYGKQSSPTGEFTEDLPIGQNHWLWDYYGRSKVEAEEQIRAYANHTIVRPSWIFGPRDRVSIPRWAEAMRAGRVRIIGPGDNALNMIDASDVACGAILAATAPSARGQAYHLCSRGEITQRELVDLFSEKFDLPPVTRQVPLRVAWSAAFVLESVFRLLKRTSPPPFTRRALYLIGRPTHFSIAKAEQELGWKPEVPIREGLEKSIDWFLEQPPANS